MFLADTNLISEARQARPQQQVLAWLSRHEPDLFISAVTIAEIQSGISLLDEGPKQAKLQKWFDTLRKGYRGTILAFDEPVAITWGKMNADLTRKGRRLPAADSFLAATALHHDLTVATRNERDFAAAGVNTVNPWLLKQSDTG